MLQLDTHLSPTRSHRRGTRSAHGRQPSAHPEPRRPQQPDAERDRLDHHAAEHALATEAAPGVSLERALDNLLAMLERRALSPMEVRVLLWVSDREATPSQLAEGLAAPAGAVGYASGSLSRRGLIRRRFDSGPASRFIFDITPAGLAVLDPLVQALAETGPATPHQPA